MRGGCSVTATYPLTRNTRGHEVPRQFTTEESSIMRHAVKKSTRIVAGLVLLASKSLLTSSLHAQELRGKITGRVMDPNGAAVAGATVKVTDVARSTTTTFTTNADGLFDALYLLPGTYQVVVEASDRAH